MRSASLTLLALIGLLLSVSENGIAQRRGRRPPPPLDHFPAFTIEMHTGVSTFSKFLEADVLYPNNPLPRGQRSVKADPAFILGGALGAWLWEGVGFRAAYTWAHTELDYKDTSGLDSDLLDRDGLNSLNAHLIGLEVVKTVFEHRRSVNPYLVAGINGEFWVLGRPKRSDAITTTKKTLFRWGGSAGMGIQFRPSRRFVIRLEAARYALGNPFEGKKAFRPESGRSFDKPDVVTMPRYTIGLHYTFIRRR